MVRTREEKRFQYIGHIIMIILTICALIPIILLVISSFTSNDELIRSGYNFFPRELSLEAYKFIFLSSNKIISAYGMSFGYRHGTMASNYYNHDGLSSI